MRSRVCVVGAYAVDGDRRRGEYVAKNVAETCSIHLDALPGTGRAMQILISHTFFSPASVYSVEKSHIENFISGTLIPGGSTTDRLHSNQ